MIDHYRVNSILRGERRSISIRVFLESRAVGAAVTADQFNQFGLVLTGRVTADHHIKVIARNDRPWIGIGDDLLFIHLAPTPGAPPTPAAHLQL